MVVQNGRTGERNRVRDAFWSTSLPLLVDNEDPACAAALEKLAASYEDKRRIDLTAAPSEDALAVLDSGGVLVPDVKDFLRLKSWEPYTFVVTEFLEGFVESGFLDLCALIYLVPLDVQNGLPRSPTPLCVW